MLAPLRTAAHDVLCFCQVHRSSYRSIAVCGSNVNHAIKARRCFSGSGSERLRVRKIPSHDIVTSAQRTGPLSRGKSKDDLDFRKNVDPRVFRQLVCERLKEIASIEGESDAAKIALQLQEVFLRPHSPKAQEWDKKLSAHKSFHEAFLESGRLGLDSQIEYTLRDYVANRQLNTANLHRQSTLADLRYPPEWYPGTRMVQRTIHLHVGPTNSGKTYQALQRLEQAESGVYAGPLRLLAHEVYTRLNAKGKPCHLVTGDDRRFNEEGSSMVSCTVEMVPTNVVVDVGVIDEIQMIGNEDRGWAWTQALLALRAKELHLCGEARTVPLIREIAAQLGEKLVLHHYERLSPLKAAKASLDGSLKQLRKGDCLVTFSRKEIHVFKTLIQKATGKRVAIVYGDLPPETRANQARLFNDPDNDYDFLVASDAIGMGLNLDIKRIIFESTWKFNGKLYEPIPIPHLKQIAGRAGRYRIAPQSKAPSPAYENISDGLPHQSSKPGITARGSAGLVTSLEKLDYPRILQAMQTEPEPVMTAGIRAPTDVLIRFAAYYPPGTSFSYILTRLSEIASVHPRYHLCNLQDWMTIADMIEPVKDLTIHDRIIFCSSPASFRSKRFFEPVLVAFAECVAKNSSGALLDIPGLHLEVLDEEVTASRDYLGVLETLHKALILYIWLSYRFVGTFKDQDMAFYVKGLVEEKIDQGLALVSLSRRQKLKKIRQRAKLENLDQAALDEEQPNILPEIETPLAEVSSGDTREEHAASQA